VALWDSDRRVLCVGDVELPRTLAQPMVDQQSRLVRLDEQTDTEMAALGVENARAALAAPISSFQKQLGVLLVFSPRSPVFANSDLELIRLLADQIAIILESRALVDQATRVHAREEAARLKEDFLSSAAHDLKTPLTGIVTQAQVLRRRAERDPTAPADRVGLDRLLEQSHRLKNLVLALLDVTRMEQGSLIGDTQDANLTEVVRTLARNEAIRWKRVQLRTTEPMVARIDLARFEQVIVNLIENALKYSPQGTPVRVELWREAGEVLLSVHDDGIGIPAEDQPLVFERFHRARNVDDRRFAGMGLGLYIARGIVEQHGGRIWVESTPGVGSTFYVALPAEGRDAVAIRDQAAPQQL
jgi:signal transduction histidine kinase